MAGKLEGLVVPVMEPLGYRHGWAGEVNRRIAEAAQSAPAGLEMSWNDVDRRGPGADLPRVVGSNPDDRPHPTQHR